MSASALVVSGVEKLPARASCDRVDLWAVTLEPGSGAAELNTLSVAERAFAARLRVGAGAWVASRATLRGILGGYVGLAPERVALTTGVNGKPRLATCAGLDLRFNLSHSRALTLIAVRLEFEVGIDVEEVRPGVDGAAIARSVFSDCDRAAMATPGADESTGTFFRTWVRREALAKATGRGIVSPPAPGAAARYTVRDLDGFPGFAAAIASEGDHWSIRQASYFRRPIRNCAVPR